MVTRVAETSHTAALRYLTAMRGKKHEIGHELYSSFDGNKNYSAVFYLAPARKLKDASTDKLESKFP